MIRQPEGVPTDSKRAIATLVNNLNNEFQALASPQSPPRAYRFLATVASDLPDASLHADCVGLYNNMLIGSDGAAWRYCSNGTVV